MFTVMQSMEIAHDIQTDQRRRAASWRSARPDRRPEVGQLQRTEPTLAPVVMLRPSLTTARGAA
jgi:hypothetical protein